MPGRDPLFAPWATATIGQPIPVRSTEGRLAYWLVPVEREARAIGFVRVSLQGEPMAAGVLYRDPSRLDAAPQLATRIGAEVALERAREAVPGGEVIDEAIYVHDGPPGREAWLVRIRERDAIRLVFVTPGGTYERDTAEAANGDAE
jgi:hypothetical protein